MTNALPHDSGQTGMTINAGMTGPKKGTHPFGMCPLPCES